MPSIPDYHKPTVFRDRMEFIEFVQEKVAKRLSGVDLSNVINEEIDDVKINLTVRVNRVADEIQVKDD